MPKLIEQMIAGTQATPAYGTSMALDYENGRPMEIEAILTMPCVRRASTVSLFRRWNRFTRSRG